MRRGVKVVAGVAAALAAAAAFTLPGAEASGDATVVVRGGNLPAGGRSQTNLVGCSSVFGRTADATAPMIGIAPGGPSGKRSIAYDLGGGNAIGPVSYVDSVASTTVASVSVHAQSGTTGVAYVGYQAPRDVGTSLVWIGRASLAAPAGSWTTVSVPSLGFGWTQYDMATQQPVGGEVGSSGIPAFVRAMGGDGAGFYMIGFGCDGNAFNTDAWRIGSPDATTTYDFEGWSTKVTGGEDTVIAPGATAQLTGRVSSPDGADVSGARVFLEAKQPDGGWAPVADQRGSSVSATVRPDETTTYRWKVYSTPSVEGDESKPFTVKVEEPSAEPDPSEQPSDQPSDGPTEQPTEQPSAPASTDTPTEAPAETPPPPAETPTPEPETVQEPAEPASEPAAPAPTDPPASEEAAAPAAAAEAAESAGS